MNPDVSVIIPVLNDRLHLAETLKAFFHNRLSGEIEVIVVDGGSTDGSQEVAHNFKATLLKSTPGRAHQMNVGARSAHGRWLWFLHADCLPDAETIRELPAYLHTIQMKWGFFRQRIAHPSLRLRFVEMGNELRGRILGLPYGDQGIIVRHDIFFKSGGFAQVPFLEDVILSRCLSQICRPTAIRKTIQISPRHWKSLGALCTTIRNMSIVFRFIILKQSPSDLHKHFLKWKKQSPV